MGEEGEKPVRQCDIGEVMDEGLVESLCVKDPKDINIGDACCSIRNCLHY